MKKRILTLLLLVFSIAINAQQRCDYKGVKFDSNFYIEDARFTSNTDFTSAKFVSNAWFHEITFTSTTNFSQVEFQSIASFSIVDFDSLADFKFAKFKSHTNFFETVFFSEANFICAKFHSDVNFFDVEFYSKALFVSVVFDSLVSFRGSSFGEVANFQFSVFNSNVDFTYTVLPKFLIFSDIKKITEDIDLTNTFVNAKYGICKIGLLNSDIDKIRFRYSNFELYFPNGTKPEVKTVVYEKLLAKQKKEGFISSIEKLEKEYKEFRYKESGENTKIGGYIMNWFDKYWWDYGYDKERIILITILLILFFTVINASLFDYVTRIVYESPNLREISNNLKGKNRLVLVLKRLPIAAFYTSIIFFGFKFDMNKLKYKENLKGWRILNLVYFFLIYIIGFICLGYLANFILNN